MRTPRGLVAAAAVLAMLLVSGCAQRARLESQHRAEVRAARAVAAEAFPEPLDALSKRSGVVVADLDRGAGLQAVPQRAFVRVPGPQAVGDLSFTAILDRLKKRDWILFSGTDTASSCTPGPQALPCEFGTDHGGGTIRIVPLAGGGYELTATAPEASPP